MANLCKSYNCLNRRINKRIKNIPVIFCLPYGLRKVKVKVPARNLVVDFQTTKNFKTWMKSPWYEYISLKPLKTVDIHTNIPWSRSGQIFKLNSERSVKSVLKVYVSINFMYWFCFRTVHNVFSCWVPRIYRMFQT